MPKRMRFVGRLLLLALPCGCSDALPVCPVIKPQAAATLAESFDATDTGTIRGRVFWDGDVPVATSTEVRAIAYHNALYKNPVRYQTTHIPQVDPQSRAVADAIVFLRGVDLRRSRPWDHAEVRVEFRDRRLEVSQGQQFTGAAFLRRGEMLETINRDADFHALRGRGAAFFTLPLIQADKPSTERLDQAGLVELTDAGGYYWSHAYCFVADHPYYARTDAEGRFALERVPAGTYEIVGWMPNWHVTRRERDPETGIIARLAWDPPVEQKQTIEMRPGQTAEITYRWSEGMFATGRLRPSARAAPGETYGESGR